MHSRQSVTRSLAGLTLIVVSCLLASGFTPIQAQEPPGTAATAATVERETLEGPVPEASQETLRETPQGPSQETGQETSQASQQGSRQGAEAEGSEPRSQRAIEEITVIGEQSMFLLRARMEAAEEALYSTYNDFNEIDDYRVECRKTNWTHTRIQEQQCWPRFFDRLVAENSQEFFFSGNLDVVPVDQLANQYSDRFAALRANILEVAREHPEVAEALLNKARLEQAYEQRREECLQQEPILLILYWCP